MIGSGDKSPLSDRNHRLPVRAGPCHRGQEGMYSAGGYRYIGR